MKHSCISFYFVILFSMICNNSLAYDIAVKNDDGVTIYYFWAYNKTELFVTYKSYSNYTSYGYEDLTSISIPESVTYLGKRYDVTGIGNSAFRGCTGLSSITIPSRVKVVQEFAFEGCSGLTSVTINSNYIISKSYSLSSSLRNIFGTQVRNYVIGENVTNIGNYAFRGCSGLLSVTIPHSVTSIGDYAFRGCSGLLSVTIPHSVTSIGDYAFYNTRIKSLTIGTGVLKIGYCAFGYDNSNGNRPIKTIWLTNTPPVGYEIAEGTINYVANNLYTSLSNQKVYSFLSSIFEVDGVIYVPVSSSEHSCDAIDCNYDESVANVHINSTLSYKGVDMTVKDVNPYTFYGHIFIKDLQLKNDGVIDYQAFAECSSLETCTLGEKVFRINDSSFYKCSKLQKIVIPDLVDYIGEYAFSLCSNLVSVTIGDGVKTIGPNAFAGCTSLTNLKIGNQVEQISNSAFHNCSVLPLIVIPPSVVSIGDYTFYNCTNLSTVIIADRIKELYLGSNQAKPLFSSCRLDSVYIGGNISYNTSSDYGYSPFFWNESLRTIHFSDKETEITDYEFYDCSNLKSVRIGNGITTIGRWAFTRCSQLDYFSFGDKVETIGQEAFWGCVNMTKIISRAQTPPTCESKALDNINKRNCELIVPSGSIPAYQCADQWKDFFYIRGLIMEGDVNEDGSIDISDVLLLVDMILGKESVTPQRLANGDLNEDGSIDICDVQMVIDIILGKQ